MRLRIGIALLICTSATLVFAQAPRPAFGNPTNSLELQIKLSNAGDIQNLARVELFRGDMPLPATYANSRGEVSWVNLADGSYKVRVELPGYQPGEEAVELTGGTIRHVIVMLYPDPNAVRSASLIPEDPLVSAKYLAAPEKARKEVDGAREARQKGDCKEAVKHGKKATEIAPDFAIAYFETGSCQLELGKVDDARKSFQTSIEKDPKFLYGYIGLARAEKQQKKWNNAAQALGQANKAQPDRAEPFYELALLQLETGHPDKAELAAKTALGRNHQYVPDLPFLLARIYVLEKKDEDAAKLLKEIADKNPNSELGQRAKRSLKLLEKANTVKK